jgi:hypothetical protein
VSRSRLLKAVRARGRQTLALVCCVGRFRSYNGTRAVQLSAAARSAPPLAQGHGVILRVIHGGALLLLEQET